MDWTNEAVLMFALMLMTVCFCAYVCACVQRVKDIKSKETYAYHAGSLRSIPSFPPELLCRRSCLSNNNKREMQRAITGKT